MLPPMGRSRSLCGLNRSHPELVLGSPYYVDIKELLHPIKVHLSRRLKSCNKAKWKGNLIYYRCYRSERFWLPALYYQVRARTIILRLTLFWSTWMIWDMVICRSPEPPATRPPIWIEWLMKVCFLPISILRRRYVLLPVRVY